MTTTTKSTAAPLPQWDLTPLYPEPDSPHIAADLDEALADARALSAQWKSRLASATPSDLLSVVTRLESIQERVQRAGSFVELHFTLDTNDAKRVGALQRVEDAATAIGAELVWVTLEWANLDDTIAHPLLNAGELAQYRHFLSTARQQRPHLLSEAEERLDTEKAPTARSGWVRLFTQVTDQLRVDMGEGDPVALDTALSALHDPDRAVRHSAAAAITEALAAEPGLTVRAATYNAVLADCALEDRLRTYDSWVASRNLANQISAPTLAALVESVTSQMGLVQRWYRLKARLLDLPTLSHADRYAPLPSATPVQVDWESAKATVLDAYERFSPKAASIAGSFFERFIDAAPRPEKTGGAFSHPTVPGAHPYILLNFTGRHDDVMTLAHELGHGIHQVLAAPQGLFNADTPLTLAETASIFGETLTFNAVLDSIDTPSDRLALVANRLEQMFATTFRQISMHQFEARVHQQRRAAGEQSVDALSDAWLDTQRTMFGDSVDITDDYRLWWSYIPHFIHTPGYVYAYAFGELLSLALFASYQATGESFVPQYFELLAAGGSDTPSALVKRMGLDLDDPDFWSAGLDVVESLLVTAETLAGG